MGEGRNEANPIVVYIVRTKEVKAAIFVLISREKLIG